MGSVRWLELFFESRKGSTDNGVGVLATRDLLAVFDGGGAVLAAGAQGDVSIPFGCSITGWVLLADVVGSVVVDIWKDTFANYPPTVADKITASAPPTISADDQAQSTTLTGWTTIINPGDCIRFNINSVMTIKRVTLALTLHT